MVEFAIIAPLLFAVLFGIIEFGFYLYNKAVVTNASREGARQGVVYAIRYDASGVTKAQTEAKSDASGYVVSLGTPSGVPSCGSNPCATATDKDGNYKSGSRLEVKVQFKYNSLFLQLLKVDNIISATTVMAYE
jgi:Flp pilus assembly protein TadG